MAGGRDLKRRAPRWLDWLLCSTGLMAAGYFVWRVLCYDGDSSSVPMVPNTLLPRILAAAVLPLLIMIAAIEKAARRLVQ